MRGPVSLPNPLTRTRLIDRPTAEGQFADYIAQTVARVAADCPQALARIDIGYEDVPVAAGDVPLATATSATPERNGQVVLYRRPLEHRAASQSDLRRLVRLTIVEQLAAITGLSPHQIDPEED
jgi:predicted Zn-dependent protease with MMP-like domain